MILRLARASVATAAGAEGASSALVELVPIRTQEANQLLLRWGHRPLPAGRPFGLAAYALSVGGRPVSVAASAATDRIARAGCFRTRVVECVGLCSAPGCDWAAPVMLRLWREVCARRWPYWPVDAAVARTATGDQTAEIFSRDGWESFLLCRGGADDMTEAGSSSTLWVWRFADDTAAIEAESTSRPSREEANILVLPAVGCGDTGTRSA